MSLNSQWKRSVVRFQVLEVKPPCSLTVHWCHLEMLLAQSILVMNVKDGFKNDSIFHLLLHKITPENRDLD